MILKLLLIVLGMSAGIFIHFRLSTMIVSRIIGLTIILFSGALACFIIINPYYFINYDHFIFSLALTGTLLVGVFIIVHIVTCKCKSIRNNEKNGLAFQTYNINNERQEKNNSIKIKQSEIIPSKLNNENLKQADQEKPGNTLPLKDAVLTEIEAKAKLSEIIDDNRINRDTLSITPQDKAVVQNIHEPDMLRQKESIDEKNDQAGPEQHDEIYPNKDKTILSKVHELITQSKYLYAVQLLESCKDHIQDIELRKQADILIIECFISLDQNEQAQKKLFEILNKRYELEPGDKLKLKEIIIKLSNTS